MRPTKAQLKKLKSLREASTAATKVWQSYREKLALTCEHPLEMIVDYKWEHDNGYGRQTMIHGKQCTVCFGKDYWSDGRFN